MSGHCPKLQVLPQTPMASLQVGEPKPKFALAVTGGVIFNLEQFAALRPKTKPTTWVKSSKVKA